MHMKQLEKLQQTFQDYVLHSDIPRAISWISSSGHVAPETRLSVYTYAYHARLREVLANDYPAMLMAIGDNQFNQLADDYIHTHPSHYSSLRDFGCHIPVFVSNLIQQDERYQDMHWLYELALYEWTLGQTFDAANDTIISEQNMDTIPPEVWPELKFRIHPSVHRLDLEWNIPEMWQALTDNKPKQVVAIDSVASPWLVWRDQLITRYRSMQTDEQLALDKLRAGNSFNEICEALTTLMGEDEVPLRAACLLKGWIAQGLISRIEY